MDFIKVLIVNMKIKHLHLRTRIKQRLFKQYGLRLLKVRKQEFYGKKFELVGMQIRLDYETGWLTQLAQGAEVIFTWVVILVKLLSFFMLFLRRVKSIFLNLIHMPLLFALRTLS